MCVPCGVFISTPLKIENQNWLCKSRPCRSPPIAGVGGETFLCKGAADEDLPEFPTGGFEQQQKAPAHRQEASPSEPGPRRGFWAPERGGSHLDIRCLLVQERLPIQAVQGRQAEQAPEGGAEQAGFLLCLQERLQFAEEKETPESQSTQEGWHCAGDHSSLLGAQTELKETFWPQMKGGQEGLLLPNLKGYYGKCLHWGQLDQLPLDWGEYWISP